MPQPNPTATTTRSSTSTFIVALALLAGAAALAMFATPRLSYSAKNGAPAARLAGNPPNPNAQGVFDLSNYANPKPPYPIFKEVKVSNTFACTLKYDGTVWCWGDNTGGQLGYDPKKLVNSINPIQIFNADGSPFNNIKDISIGVDSPNKLGGCALKNDGTIWCWGSGMDQSNPWSGFIPPTQMMMASGIPITNAVKIDAKVNTCFIKSDTTAWCWGLSRIGNSTVSDSNYPVQVQSATGQPIKNVSDISTGNRDSCATYIQNANGQPPRVTECWGTNDTNQLGDGTNIPFRDNPDYVMDFKNKPLHFYNGIKLGVGDYQTCMIDQFGSLACWGQCNLDQTEYFKQILKPGNGFCADAAKYFPDGIGKQFTQITDISSGAAHSCAIQNNDKLYCWGWNGQGQLGDGSFVDNFNAPVRVLVPPMNPVVGISYIDTGDNATCAIWQGIAVACWGNNSSNKLGNGCNQKQCVWPTVVKF